MANNKNYLFVIVVLLLIIAFLLGKQCSRPAAKEPTANVQVSTHSKNDEALRQKPNDVKPANSNDITALTNEDVVVAFVKQNGRLPEYYITKGEARRQGWNAGQGNLCDVLPGRAIGGDIFTNRDGNLPEGSGRKWYEADLNYDCGRRNADRLLYSNDGLVFVTHDHYKTFEQK